MSQSRPRPRLRTLVEGRVYTAVRTVLSGYFLIVLAGARPAFGTLALPGPWSAGLALIALTTARAVVVNRNRLDLRQGVAMVQRYWAEIAVAALTAAGLALRLRGIDFGAPLVIHPDEHVVVGPVVDMLRRGWIDPPVPYHYPTVFKYLLLPAFALTFVRGRSHGEWLSLDDLHRWEFPFYLVARYHSAILGALTIPLVYLLARRVDPTPRGRVAGVFGAALIAGSFIHVRESHYAVTDAPMTFFVTLALLAIMALMGRNRWWTYLLAGFAAGISCAVKYNALPAVLVIPVAHVLARRPTDWLNWKLIAALGMVPLGFFVGYPYALLRWPAFLEHVGWIRRFQVYDAPARLEFLVGYAMESGLGVPAMLALAAACVWYLYRALPRQVLLIAYLAVSLYMLTHTGHRLFPRYLLPLLPAAVVLIGTAMSELVQRVGEGERSGRFRFAMRAVVGAILIVSLAAPTVSESLSWTRQLQRPDTRALAYRHVVDRHGEDATVATDVRYFQLGQARQVVDLEPIDEGILRRLRRGTVDLIIVSAQQEQQLVEDRDQRREWRRLQRRLELVRSFDAAELEANGPSLRVYRFVPQPSEEEPADDSAPGARG